MGLGLLLLLNLNHADAQVKDDGWKQLFNGKDLTGWKEVGKGTRYVKDGTIRSHGGMGLLYYTGGKLSNCIIKVVQLATGSVNGLRLPMAKRRLLAIRPSPGTPAFAAAKLRTPCF